MLRLRNGCTAEGVGLDDVRTGFQVLLVDARDGLGARERQQVVVALQEYFMLLHAGRSEVFFLQLQPLDHGAHGTVQDEDAVLCELFDRWHG